MSEAGMRTSTRFIEDNLKEFAHPPPPTRLENACAGILFAAAQKNQIPGAEPFYRSNPFSKIPLGVELNGDRCLPTLERLESWKYRMTRGSESVEVAEVAPHPHGINFSIARVKYHFRIEKIDSDRLLVDSVFGVNSLKFPSETSEALTPQEKGVVRAPMAGRVVRVAQQLMGRVKHGDILLVLEAMKMEQVVKAPSDGILSKVLVAEGAQVVRGDILVVYETAE